MLLLIAGFALVAGCGSDDSEKDAAAAARARAQAARHARLMVAGRRAFVARCASCHTIEGRVAHPTFIESPIPNLDQVAPRAEYVRERIEFGGIDMASFTQELTPAQLEAVVAYVTDVAGSDVVETAGREPELVTEGEQIFDDNCQRCHGIDGRRATNRPRYVYPGTDFNRVKPSQELVEDQVRKGIEDGMMPSFRGKLTPEQIHAVAVYVTATAGR